MAEETKAEKAARVKRFNARVAAKRAKEAAAKKAAEKPKSMVSRALDKLKIGKRKETSGNKNQSKQLKELDKG
jgi:hypothetical protein